MSGFSFVCFHEISKSQLKETAIRSENISQIQGPILRTDKRRLSSHFRDTNYLIKNKANIVEKTTVELIRL